MLPALGNMQANSPKEGVGKAFNRSAAVIANKKPLPAILIPWPNDTKVVDATTIPTEQVKSD
jgi:hypothetical protein